MIISRNTEKILDKIDILAFPGGQWLRIHLPIQGTWV